MKAHTVSKRSLSYRLAKLANIEHVTGPVSTCKYRLCVFIGAYMVLGIVVFLGWLALSTLYMLTGTPAFLHEYAFFTKITVISVYGTLACTAVIGAIVGLVYLYAKRQERRGRPLIHPVISGVFSRSCTKVDFKD